MQTRILQPGEIEQLAASAIPLLRLPERGSLFASRAARLRQLAQGHALGPYLEFLAEIATAQQRLLSEYPACDLPGPAHLARCQEHGMPPLGALGLTRDSSWRLALARLLGDLARLANEQTRAAIASLQSANEAQLESMATALLSGETEHLDLATAPFLAAALQVHWVHLATTLGPAQFPPIEPVHLCPVCGSRPVASIVRLGGAEGGYRYLHCSLCASEWHMVRIKCSNCESTKGIAYYGLEDRLAAVKAETCDECKSYLKILYMDKDPLVEPSADDLASLALDLLVGEKGYLRSGPNLMLLHGPD